MEEDTSKIRDTTGTVFIQGPSNVLLVWRSIIFKGSFLRLCRILRFVKKIRFSLLESGQTKAWCPGLVSRPSAKAWEPLARSRGQWQEVEGLIFIPKTLSWCIFWAFIPRMWFPYSSFQQVRQPLIPSSVEEDTPKIRGMTRTVFIQGPSILLLVWRNIMFNGSFLRVCRILRFVQKIRFSLLESGRTKPWCMGLVSPPSAKA